MNKVTIDGKDVTEHVAAMFDAIVHSLDWGSGFLDVDTIDSILVVGKLCGFGDPFTVDAPVTVAQQAWRAQSEARIAARIAELKGEV